jgi:peptide/nickel transport system substrate-binding protein
MINRRAGAGLAALALLTAACSGTANGPDGSSSGSAYELTATTPEPSGDLDSFTWSIYAEPFSLDYAYAFDYPPNQVLSNVCESLLRWNPDLSISPSLAEKFENPTPTTWVYTIRKGVTFHDGSPLTPDDVVASLRRHLDPAVGSYWASAFANVKSIEKTSDDQVTVTLTRPDSMFNQYMAVSPGTIESARTLATAGKDYGNSSTGVNCTGPFAFDSWKPGEGITLKRYDDYWDPELKARSGQVRFVFLSDANTRVNAWASGQVDGGWQVPANAYAQLQGSGAGSLYFGVNTTVVNEIVSNTSGVLGDKRVRQALLMATDRAGIVQAGEQGVGEVAESMVSRNNWESSSTDQVDSIYDALPTYDHDVEAAKALAQEAGVHGQQIVIATSPAFESADVITSAVAQAAKEIGLDPKIETISADQYGALFSDPAARKGIDLFLTIWYTSLADPMEFYGVVRTGQFSNYGGWSSSKFDTLADEAIGTPVDDPARTDVIAQAQEVAMDELPWLPLYTLPTSVWMGDRITGVQPSIAFLYYPWAAEIGAR